MKEFKWKPDIKNTCSSCGLICNRKGMVLFKKKLICGRCRNMSDVVKKQNKIQIFRVSMKEALNRTYEAKPRFKRNNNLDGAICWFPKILAGRNFKIVLVNKVPKSKKKK